MKLEQLISGRVVIHIKELNKELLKRIESWGLTGYLVSEEEWPLKNGLKMITGTEVSAGILANADKKVTGVICIINTEYQRVHERRLKRKINYANMEIINIKNKETNQYQQ